MIREAAQRPRTHAWRAGLAVLCGALTSCGSLSLTSLFPSSRGAIEPENYSASLTRKEAPVGSLSKEVSAPPKTAGPNSAKPPAAKTPVVTISPGASPIEDSAIKRQAEETVDEAVQKLGGVDRSKLSADSATDYDVVSAFIKRARGALQEQDFVRAQSLAEKAKVLAGQLASRSAGP